MMTMTTPAASTIELQASATPVMNQPQLSVIIPVFNERYTIRELIRRVQSRRDEQGNYCR